MQDINGGNSVQQGRGVGEKQTIQFTWITKQLLIFNSGCLPSLDFTDAALIDRLIVLQHRSKFCTSSEEFQAERQTPHTFMADPDMASKMRDLRPYTLRWFLEGLQRYHDVGFSELPEQCTAWKDALVKTHDTVGAFVSERLQKTDLAVDYVQRSELYREYKEAYAEERNPKTSLGKQKWFEQMKRHMGQDQETGFFTRKKVKVQHQQHMIPKKDIWIGWTMCSDG